MKTPLLLEELGFHHLSSRFSLFKIQSWGINPNAVAPVGYCGGPKSRTRHRCDRVHSDFECSS